MTLPAHILVATDLSEASSPALTKSLEFAKTFGAKLSVIHVFDPSPLVPPIAIPAPRSMEASLEKEMADRIGKELENLRATRLAGTDAAVVLEKHPNPALAICEYASKHGADLIIVGTHGRTGISHVLIGSVAERVVRHAKVPVLTVPSKG